MIGVQTVGALGRRATDCPRQSARSTGNTKLFFVSNWVRKGVGNRANIRLKRLRLSAHKPVEDQITALESDGFDESSD